MSGPKISLTAVIYPGVELGTDVIIEDYCVIGIDSFTEKKALTVIGNNAHVRSHTVIYAGVRIGNGFTAGNKANIRENCIIGDGVSIGTHSVVERDVIIEGGVRIHSGAFIPEHSVLKSGCWIGPNAVLTNAKYPLSKNSKLNLKGPTIGENAIIGANSTIMPGVKIGKGSLVASAAVVTKDVTEGSVVAGVPARKVKSKSDILEYG